MHDATGSKNSVQAVGSSITYGKRYAAGALLNFVAGDEKEDDYGTLAGQVSEAEQLVNGEQLAALEKRCEEIFRAPEGAVHRSFGLFLEHFKINAISELPAKDYDMFNLYLDQVLQNRTEKQKAAKAQQDNQARPS
jgi:hypothetical protein